MKKVLKTVLSLFLMISLSACGKTDNAGSFKPGSYEGSATGMNGEITVEVEFDETTIKNITVISHSETPGISDGALEQIPSDIVKYQSLGVDSVSGASFTSKGLLEAVSNAVASAGGDVEALKEVPVNKEAVSEKVVKTSEVVVVGGGSAGLAAAISAAQSGSEVILIEANSYLGGNTLRSAGGAIICDPDAIQHLEMSESHFDQIDKLLSVEMEKDIAKEWQNKVRKDIEEYKKENKTGLYDSVELTSIQYYLNNYQRPNPERLYEMFESSVEIKDWLAGMGFNWTDVPSVLVGHGWPRNYFSKNHKAGNGYIEVMSNYIADQNLDIEIIKNLRGNELIMDGDRVAGVKATSKDNQVYELNATKGVILATGGYSGNQEMLKKYSDGYFKNVENSHTDNDPSIQGDGILMAEKAGADFYDIGHIQLLPTTDPDTGDTRTFAGSTTGLYINKEGHRFVNETADRDTMSKAILEQTDGVYYVISCEQNNGIDDNGLNMLGYPMEKLLEDGKVIKADTLEELAEKIHIEKEVLLETVNRFNEACRSGIDEEFGRVTFTPDVIDAGASLEINEGPYYACLRAPAVHMTKGGILIDGEGHVMNKDGNQIEGLLAAGEVTGGIAVNGIGHSLFTGKIAGETVSR